MAGYGFKSCGGDAMNRERDPDGLLYVALVAGHTAGHRAARAGLPDDWNKPPPEWRGHEFQGNWQKAFHDGWVSEKSVTK